ncbi:aromatic ring-hydroxylating oxygenase subunit alpha [Aidingimonas halophila]|uniref:Rieske 2Fe-2S family protein n=1 Tax=Aidingimonas halophila TaxID=574349 RepID=A0A1H2UA09_9GAMM|nr:aromatic ring-hydroxylating dioxygenase subunit alpha [Aidingimonas halophila]GHC22353.1 protein GbcA [Aidingimonas halophila]SDW52807.1 Rieske 2Fe-2S family protein [Aidingimonas halophila]
MPALPSHHLDDPLASVREATSTMLEQRAYGYSLPQPFYNDARLFALDMQEIYAKEWLFAGHTCEIPSKGNYMTLQIGDGSVIIVRGDKGTIHAFHNTCRHRGSRLCTAERGKVAKLVCPYHQWTYDLDGRLLFAGTEMGPDFDLSDHGLAPVAVRSGGGYIFINLGDNPAPIDDFLVSLEHYYEPYDMENVKVAAESNIIEQGNWKLVMENNRECYHCDASHPELLKTLSEFDDAEDPRATPQYKTFCRRKQADWDSEHIPWQQARFGRRNRLARTPLLEGAVSMTLDGKLACQKLMGRMTSADMGTLRMLHLPNSWNHFCGDHGVSFRVLPISAQETLVTTKWLVHKDAVEGVDYDVERLRYVWDATNAQDRQLVEENQRGVNSMAYRPGPYSPTYEFAVIDFVEWYSERMQDNLNQNASHLHLAQG